LEHCRLGNDADSINLTLNITDSARLAIYVGDETSRSYMRYTSSFHFKQKSCILTRSVVTYVSGFFTPEHFRISLHIYVVTSGNCRRVLLTCIEVHEYRITIPTSFENRSGTHRYSGTAHRPSSQL